MRTARRGRWHLYWVDVSDEEIDRIQAGTRHAWYARFWRDDRLLVVYDDARFSMDRHDQSTWEPAVVYCPCDAELVDEPPDDQAAAVHVERGGFAVRDQVHGWRTPCPRD